MLSTDWHEGPYKCNVVSDCNSCDSWLVVSTWVGEAQLNWLSYSAVWKTPSRTACHWNSIKRKWSNRLAAVSLEELQASPSPWPSSPGFHIDSPASGQILQPPGMDSSALLHWPIGTLIRTHSGHCRKLHTSTWILLSPVCRCSLCSSTPNCGWAL